MNKKKIGLKMRKKMIKKMKKLNLEMNQKEKK